MTAYADDDDDDDKDLPIHGTKSTTTNSAESTVPLSVAPVARKKIHGNLFCSTCILTFFKFHFNLTQEKNIHVNVPFVQPAVLSILIRTTSLCGAIVPTKLTRASIAEANSISDVLSNTVKIYAIDAK